MKKFNFSLQTVHDLKTARCEEAERALAQARTAVAAATAEMEAHLNGRLSAITEYLSTLSNGVESKVLTLHAEHIATLAAREQQVRNRLSMLERAQEEQRAATARATQEAKVIDKLRETHRARHSTTAAQHEQTMLDELATIIFAHRRR